MKQIILICALLGLTSCMVNYPMTTFYVKNTTNETLNFKASVIKHSSMGPHEMTLPFAVPPNDSVVARQVGFKKGIEPTAWFSKFVIFPSDSLTFNDPNDSANWEKTMDEKGRPVYTFNMTK